MKQFTTTVEMIEAATIAHNATASHSDKHFSTEEVERYFVTSIMRQSMVIKYSIQITGKQTNIIHGFGYVEA